MHNEAAIEKSLKIVNSDNNINIPVRLQVIICLKKELLSLLSSKKLMLIRRKCYQCKLVCTGLMNEWCKILTIKTLTEVNRT